MESPPPLVPALRLFTWIPIATPPTSEEALADGHSLLVRSHTEYSHCPRGYTLGKNQFYQHCQRYDSFDDEPVPGWSREEESNSCLEWEMEEVYPEGHEDAEWGSTVTHWILVPDAPSETQVENACLQSKQPGGYAALRQSLYSSNGVYPRLCQ